MVLCRREPKGEVLFAVCRREPKGKVLSEVSSLKSQAGHHQKADSSLQHQPMLTPSGGGEVLFVVLCRREPKGKAGKCTVLAMLFLVMFFGDKCDAHADAR